MTNINIASQPNSPSQVPLRTWIGVLACMLGAFMAILDIQITNASLQDIQASLGASLDEGSWISTSYLVAEIVVIPLTGWLSRVFSLRRYLLVNTALFIFFSICCAGAWNLNSMIVFRALQGFTGGVLIPSAMTVVLTSLPPQKQPAGLAAFGITAVFAPSIGPTLGGWLTENFSWHYSFYINIFPGILMLAGVWYGIYQQKPQFELLKKGDWWGIASMAIGLSCLQIVLEEGSRKDWFGSSLIVRLTVIAVICLVLFFVIELTRKQPFINLKLLRDRNFGLAAIVNVSLGIGLYGSIYVLPLYLAQIQKYNALQIGQVLVWAGVPQLFIIPFIPKLMQRIDVRLIVAVGVSLFSISAFMNAKLTNQTGYDQLIWSQLVRAMGQPLIMVPLTSIATASLPAKEAGSASGLFNMMRNLGGSIGIASLATLLTNREQFHSNRLSDSVSLFNPATQERINQLTQYFVSRGSDLSTAQEQALKSLDGVVRREAYVMAFNDCFYFIGIALLLSGVAILFFKKVKPKGSTVAH
ncbi:DHA2 family efflux MFS transporter permease subunit [Brunnivagina elsteri]|uniref:EmrB/QacA family drug resistance transporter n=1 Tax=Brunnivagina elsteri CCALA 953 TaxID=987040 RepID=A0A2A2TDA5_9CYAN|nr:DHA2 family efflux MFS transporter permease subunit [Calothrix elsteri]PAX51734.1 EmrB/QacA family drug resistance transporter [Calothrix elsteri CCALA 953]